MSNDNQKDLLSYWQSRALDAERERDELAAHVERLRTLAKESQGWDWLSAWEEAEDAGAVNLLIPEMQELVDQVDAETPAQSLREVRAEAVEACLARIDQFATEKQDCMDEIHSFAGEIRSGER